MSRNSILSSKSGCSRTRKPTALVAVAMLVSLFAGPVSGQDTDFTQFDARSVYQQLDTQISNSPQNIAPSWWDAHVTNSLRDEQPLPADVHTLLYLALQHSNQIKIAKRDPLIRETEIQAADSRFDWTKYLNTAWNDTSEPIGNQLTAGGTATQFDDSVFQGTGGVRRLTRYGGILDISQRFGWQDNNSIFLTPDEQATSQFTLSYTHPLLRGRGLAYNNSLVFLAKLDAEAAQQDFMAVLQEELLEITRNYWALYKERAILAHKMRLFLKTQKIFQTLNARKGVDTQGTQLITASSALENRRADLIRAKTAVTNAETRLRGLINAPELANTDVAELIPAESPVMDFVHAELQTELHNAIRSRPEIKAAIQQVKAGANQLGIAQHEMLPGLNLVTQGYLSGLQGDSDFARSFTDQFSVGRPSYSVGLQYEMPIGNRQAKARVCRRKHELARLQDEYSRAVQAVSTEVDIAVRELNTSYKELGAKGRALAAAEAEANTIEQRWLRMVDGSGSAGLNLESLLRAQERVTETEEEYVNSVLTYNLAMVNLKRSNGTLLQTENVNVSKGCQGGCQEIHLSKNGPAAKFNESVVTPACQTCSAPTAAIPMQATPIEEPQTVWTHPVPANTGNVMQDEFPSPYPKPQRVTHQTTFNSYQN